MDKYNTGYRYYRLIAFLIIATASVFTIFANPKRNSLENRLKTTQGAEKYNILINLSKDYEEDLPDYSINYAEQALDLANTLNDDAFITDAISRLGLAYMSAGQYGKSHEFLTKYLTKVEKSGDEKQIVFTNNNIGTIYKLWGDYNSAIEYNLKALKTAGEINDTLGSIVAYNSIGSIYTDWEKYENALQNLNKAYSLSVTLKDKVETIRTLMNLGQLYAKKRSVSQAQAKYFEAISLAEAIGRKSLIANSYFELGNIYLDNPPKFAQSEKDKYQKPLDYFNQAIETYRILFSKVEIGKTFIKLGITHLKRNELAEAEKNLNEGLNVVSQQNLKAEMMEAFLNLSTLYKKKNNFKLAYDYLNKYTSLSDSIFSDVTLKKFSDMGTRLEVEKREKDIQLLKKEQETTKYIQIVLVMGLIFILAMAGLLFHRFTQNKKINALLQENNNKIESAFHELKIKEESLTKLNSILTKTNDDLNKSQLELSKSNATKSKFLSIIAHDIKNPLQGMILSTEVLKQYDRLTTDKLVSLINGLNETSVNLSDLVSNLLNWVRNQSSSVQYVPMITDLHSLVVQNFKLAKINANKKNITLINNLKEPTSAYCDYNLINTVFRNLITNAIKFTPENGEISISSEDNIDEIAITVEDNGVGIPPEVIGKLFDNDEFHTTQGTSKEKGTGLGLKLCSEFVELNKGTIRVESELGLGTKFIFTLPK